MSIRAATLEDWPRLSQMIGDFNAEKCEKFGEPDFTRMHLDACHLAITQGYGGVYVAEKDGVLVGYCAWLSLPTMPAGVVDGIGTYVVPDLRRTRIAEELTLAAIEFHKARGMRAAYGAVSLENVPSLGRMKAYGAEPVATVFKWDLSREAKHRGV